MGAVTSTAEGLDGRPFALGYLRCRSQGSQVRPAALPPCRAIHSAMHLQWVQAGCARLPAQCPGAPLRGVCSGVAALPLRSMMIDPGAKA